MHGAAYASHVLKLKEKQFSNICHPCSILLRRSRYKQKQWGGEAKECGHDAGKEVECLGVSNGSWLLWLSGPIDIKSSFHSWHHWTL